MQPRSVAATLHRCEPSAHVGAELMSVAQTLRPDLVVMECYGQSRNAERVLGGAMWSVLEHDSHAGADGALTLAQKGACDTSKRHAGLPEVLVSEGSARATVPRQTPSPERTVQRRRVQGKCDMPNLQCSNYRGFSVTTRGTETETPIGKTFQAGYTVYPSDRREPWQYFVRAPFDSLGQAMANALSEAQRSIDLDRPQKWPVR